MNVKQRVFTLIEKAEDGNKFSVIIDYLLLGLIIINVLAVIAGSYTEIETRFATELHILEIVSVLIFTIEYILRLWTARLKFPNAKHPYLKYIFSFMAIVDLLAILPFYLPLLFTVDLRYLRLLRLFRILRILKLNRYNDALNIISQVLLKEKEKLSMILFIIAMLILIAASSMYYIEHAVQPENFPNIPSTIWWAVVTLTTIGYGDVYPMTGLGKALSGIIAILGIGLIALPTGIISSGFISEHNKNKNCPHCGKKIE